MKNPFLDLEPKSMTIQLDHPPATHQVPPNPMTASIGQTSCGVIYGLGRKFSLSLLQKYGVQAALFAFCFSLAYNAASMGSLLLGHPEISSGGQKCISHFLGISRISPSRKGTCCSFFPARLGPPEERRRRTIYQSPC